MALTLKAGMKLNSAVCAGQIMVLRAPKEPLDLRCGGAEMSTEEAAEKSGVDKDFAHGLLVGKRYVDEEETMEFLCTRGGEGGLSLGSTPLGVKQAKALPSSD
ncbi:MAG: hypothetical protein AAF850_01710 [Pseudomonadota bacterium]